MISWYKSDILVLSKTNDSKIVSIKGERFKT